MNERNALRALRRGDEAALAWLIERYSAYVGTIVYNIIGRHMSLSDVEEVTSDVFLTAWSNADKIRSGKLKAYLSGTARNKALEKTRKMDFVLPLEDDIIVIDVSDPQRDIEAREQTQFIRSAVLALSQPDREIFLRHYYYCQTVAQISDEMKINISTVKTRLRRGREKLKEILCERGYRLEAEDI